MKRKLIIALAAAMTITLGSVGVVSADDTNFAQIGRASCRERVSSPV